MTVLLAIIKTNWRAENFIIYPCKMQDLASI